MTYRRLPFARAVLLLIVALGPLQAQAVFACAMMDAVVHGCCCDEQEPDAAIAESSDDPCCEQSVEIRVDDEARQTTPVVKLDARSDPPEVFVASFDAFISSERLSPLGHVRQIAAAGRSGADTYLVTQRLRI